MADNEEMLKTNADLWKKNVKIIGISIDQEAENLEAHLKSKDDWTRVNHYLKADSDCLSTYGVTGLPNIMLVDRAGKIVFKGHPFQRELAADLFTLLHDHGLIGPGCAPLESMIAEVDEEEPVVDPAN